MNFLPRIRDWNLSKSFIEGNIGLEKEGLRVAENMNLSRKNHPIVFDKPKYITTDFGEAQPELITPSLTPYKYAYNFLEALSDILISNLPAEEYIWPLSVPCRLPEEKSIKISQTNDIETLKYREYTSEKYGKKRQLISGIHINYSFSNEFIEEYYKKQMGFTSIKDFKNELYLTLSSNFLRYQWLLIYLFGATPIAEDDFFEGPFFEEKKIPSKPMRSLRNSEYGFNNEPYVTIRYDTVNNYVHDLTQAVNHGFLAKEREYYGDIRLRGFSKQAKDLLETGIEYIEVRSFDLNPFHVSGLTKEMLQFTHLFFLTMICLPYKSSPEETVKGNRLTKQVAKEHPHSKTALYKEGMWILENMEIVAQNLELETSYQNLINNAGVALTYPEKTIAGRLTTLIQNKIQLLNLGELLGFHHKNQVLKQRNLLGFNHLDQDMQKDFIQKIIIGEKIDEKYFEDSEDFQMDI